MKYLVNISVPYGDFNIYKELKYKNIYVSDWILNNKRGVKFI